MFYLADAEFFTGAAEIMPIRSDDKLVVGAGGRGLLTTDIQKRFFDLITGEPEELGWFTCVEQRMVASQHEPQLA